MTSLIRMTSSQKCQQWMFHGLFEVKRYFDRNSTDFIYLWITIVVLVVRRTFMLFYLMHLSFKKCIVPRKFDNIWNIVVELRSPPTSVKWRMTEHLAIQSAKIPATTNSKTYPGTVMIDK